MTPEHYTRIRKGLGLTQAQLAEALDSNRVTIARRETGALITREAALAILGIEALQSGWKSAYAGALRAGPRPGSSPRK